MKRLVVNIGDTFGTWKVLSEDFSKSHKSFFCICKCGSENSIRSFHLINGNSTKCKFCGPTKHGQAKGNRTLAYKSWEAMIQRCTNQKNISFKNYGLIGVKICKRWLKFENFYADMGDRPEGKTLDRIKDPKTGEPYLIYSKKTCKYSTLSEQSFNRRIINKLGVTGVRRASTGRYEANIKFKQKAYYIGTFDSLILASLAIEACRNVLISSLQNEKIKKSK